MYDTLIRGYWMQDFFQFHERILIDFFRSMAPKYSYAKIVGREASLDVPNIVHFIWLGKVLPGKYIKNMKTFNNNTGYKVNL